MKSLYKLSEGSRGRWKGRHRLHRSITAETLAVDARLGTAFDWLCKRRKDWPAGADVWVFRRRWPQEKVRIQQELLAGSYEMGLLSRVMLWHDG